MQIHNEKLLENFYSKDKLNVAIVTDIFFPTFGGVSFVVDNLAKAFMASGKVNVAVFTGAVKGYQDNAPYPVIRAKSFPIPKSWGDSQPVPAIDKKLKKLIEKMQIDVVDVHSVWGMSTFFMKYAKKNGLPIVYHGHGMFDSEYPTYIKFKPICKNLVKRGYKIVNKADLVMPVSNITKENYRKNGVDRPMQVLPNATDMTESIDISIANKTIYEKHGISDSFNNVFVFASRLEMECKNIGFLLESLKAIKEAGVQFKMLIVGGGKDKDNIVNLAEKLGIINDIVMAGEVFDRDLLKCYYRRADLHLFPSVKDSCALTKFEAASQFTPTIAIENTGVSEEINDGINGYISTNNVNDYSSKIISAITDRERLKEISHMANKTLVKSWNASAQTCIEQYYRLLEEHKKNN